MKRIQLALIALVISFGSVKAETEKIEPVSLNISKRVPLDLADTTGVRVYATSNSYYFTPNLKEGMRVLFSASYGVGGEAAQMSGVLVYRDGKFWCKPKANPSANLLLPPGYPLNGHGEHSLWDVEAYMHLINRVAFSDPNQASKTAHDVYDSPEAALVDFRGGTAGQFVDYFDAMEVVFAKKLENRSNSELKIYYARGTGPVALEFRENMSPAGTFKFYLGE